MLFNSYIFVLFFLPVTLFLYFGLNHFHREEMAKIILIAMSLWFYAYFHVNYLIIIVLSVLFNYGISKALLRAKENITQKKIILWMGVICNISIIFYFKYFNFFLENLNSCFHTSFPLKNILLPLGISFFTFQQISYLVDSYRGETVRYGLIDYALFVIFFPQLIAGPIVTHEEMMPQFHEKERKQFNQEKFACGLYWFSIGMFKKVMLADTLGKAADWGFAYPNALSGIGTFVLSLIYSLQLYFDFSGYCDMACGVASMFHIDLPVNFNSPYKAVSIIDFWKRWHISLTRFLRKYIYFPLGGNRGGKCKTLLNIMAVFLVSGIWHGANWTYILWGCIHGIAHALNRILGKLWDKVPILFKRLLTFLFIDLTWILFRSNSLSDCKVLFSNMLTGKPGGIPREIIECFNIIEFTYLEEHIPVLERVVNSFSGINMWIVMGISFFIVLLGKNCYEKNFKPTMANGLGCVVLLVWSIMSLSGLSIFLYFNF